LFFQRPRTVADATAFEARRTAQSNCLRHPACPGLSDGILSAQQEDEQATCPLLSSFTRLERRKSLIERHRLNLMPRCTVKLYRRISPVRGRDQPSSGR
jgi:hypothetical protein